jgi:hypothetical protein
MTKQTTATFELKSWDEKPYEDLGGGAKLTRASVVLSYKGSIDGEGKIEFLMMYPEEKYATYVGLERVTGSLDGRKGSFVLQHTGTFKGGIADSKLLVVPDSGSDELHDLHGEGRFLSGEAETYSITLDYSFE